MRIHNLYTDEKGESLVGDGLGFPRLQCHGAGRERSRTR
jgi:hypothetical protein